MPHPNSFPSITDPPAPPRASVDTERSGVSGPTTANTRLGKPWRIPGALAVLAVGSTLTFTASSSISGVRLSTVGLLVMLVALAVLTGLLVRAVIGLRRHDSGRRATTAPRPDSATRTAPAARETRS